MTEINERVTVDFDSESYYLDGEYWESWDNYGEEMADKINELFNELQEEKENITLLAQHNYDESKRIINRYVDKIKELERKNKELKKEDELFFGKVFDILLKYQDLFNREMADEVLEELGIELTRWFE